MAGRSSYFARTVLRFFFRNTAITPPAGIYAALYPGDPGPEGISANEIVGNAYQREIIAFNDVPGTGDPGPMTNLVVTWPAATGTNGWGPVTHIGLWDNPAGGNFIGGIQLQNAKIVGAGDIFRVPAGNLSISIT